MEKYTTTSYTPEQIQSIPASAFQTRRYFHRFASGGGEYRKYEVIHASQLPEPLEVVVETTHQEKRFIFPDGRIFSNAVKGEKVAKPITIEWGETPMRTIPEICFMAEVK